MNPSTSRRGQRALVTGAGGFIGQHLVRRLRDEGADVTALTRDQVDLTDRDQTTAAVAAAAPHVVFHLAAGRARDSAADRAATVAVNTLSAGWIVEAVPAGCRAVIRLGSSTEYAASDNPMDEATPLRPRGFFGATKAAGSLLFAAAAAERGVTVRELRAFQVYGPGDKPERLVPTLLTAARDGSAVPLTRPGLRRDWVWVGDVVEACLLAAIADLPTGSVHNIGTGLQTANEDMARLTEEVTGRPVHMVPGAHPGRSWDSADWVCDPTAARFELGWKPQIDLAEGIARCWAVFR